MRRAIAAVVTVAVLTACGGEEQEIVAPPRVDPALAPGALGDDLRLFENTDDETVAAFAAGGERSLVSDGRIWEVRRADRLIGTLQLSTVLPEVDLSEPRVRQTVVRQIIPGAVTRLRIDGVEVVSATLHDKAVFVWFGAELYGVLQMRDRQIEDFEPLVAEVIRHMATEQSWVPLPDLLEEL